MAQADFSLHRAFRFRLFRLRVFCRTVSVERQKRRDKKRENSAGRKADSHRSYFRYSQRSENSPRRKIADGDCRTETGFNSFFRRLDKFARRFAEFQNCITEIAKIAPTFAVRGNWDVWYWYNQNLFEGTGVRALNGEPEKIEINGVPIRLAGIFVDSERKTAETIRQIPKNEFSIFLYHYPDLIEPVSDAEIDLYCAGHTHGGQVAMPFYGALVTLSKFGKKYEGGTYEVGKTSLNVNRGIGMEGGNTPRVRFWARPEITVIDIIPE